MRFLYLSQRPQNSPRQLYIWTPFNYAKGSPENRVHNLEVDHRFSHQRRYRLIKLMPNACRRPLDAICNAATSILDSDTSPKHLGVV